MVKKDYWLIGLTTVCLFFSFSILKPLQFGLFPVSVAQNLPSLQSHPLPSSLIRWDENNQEGDYFNLVKTTPVGYLVWSQFPLKIYIEQPQDQKSQGESAEDIRFQQWVQAVRNAVTEWNVYLPLQEIDKSELADIVIIRSSVEREIELNPDTGLYDIPQAITAQTNYEFYIKESQPKILAHRMIIKISPDLGQPATSAAARHELGHGLGIWGHSDLETDALYFSQVRNTPQISARDINTLKKIYQQPTRLGWEILN